MASMSSAQSHRGKVNVTITDAQRDVRRVYAGGFHGQLVSAAVWLAAAAVAQWVSTSGAVLVLFLGGTLIFPLTWLIIRLTGHPASLPAGHPMAGLATQIAFTVPIGLVVVVTMLAGRAELFFPASMVIVGAHYLPFVFLYGMRMFAYLSVALVAPGVAFLWWVPVPLSLGGWITGAVLVIFAFLLHAAAADMNAEEPASA
jgi:hypothetical protein